MARAIVLEPRVLLFDEPLSNLDAKLRRKVRDDIRDLQQRLGLTVLYVTHDQQEALAVSDKVIVMDNAVIAQQGSPRDLYERPNSRFLADFIGEANLIQGSRTPPAAAGLQGRRPDAADGDSGDLDRGPARPDHAPARAGRAFPDPRRSFVGAANEYTVAAPWGELLVIRPTAEPDIEAGATVALEIDRGAAIPLP